MADSTQQAPAGMPGRRDLPGSNRSATGTVKGEVNGDALATITVVLRRRAPMPSLDELAGAQSGESQAGSVKPDSTTSQPPHRDTVRAGSPLDAQTLGERYGADPADIQAAEDVFAQAGLKVVETDAASRRMRVEGPLKTLQDVFGTKLSEAQVGEHTFRARTGSLSLPSKLDGIVTAVLGLDDRPAARTRHVVARAASSTHSYTPPQLAQLYAMPDADGSGQRVAIIELGGGFGTSDLKNYFSSLKIAQPTVNAISVDGAKNVAGKDPQGADGEVLLDIEVAGAIAPGAAFDVYFAPNTDAGFLDAIAQATHAEQTPCAISISWGQSEDQWTAQARSAMDEAFADAAAMGIVVLAAAGDNGSADGQNLGNHCDYPASSPNAVGCGGTSLKASGSTVSSETVWNDGASGGATGGGVSDKYPVPAWQKTAGVPQSAGAKGATSTGRGVPDVAGNADPETGYQVLVDGTKTVIGGTSAVAPLWAGLIARIAQLSGKRIGPIQPKLYATVKAGQSPSGLRDITSGSNGAYVAGAGWDACTGLGVPATGIEKLLG